MACKSCSSPRDATPLGATHKQFADAIAPTVVTTSVNPVANVSPVPLSYVANAPAPQLPAAPACGVPVPDPTAVGCGLPQAPSASCFNPTSKASQAPCPMQLPPSWANAAPANSIVPLGRAGNTLAQLIGTGYAFIKDGVMSVVESICLSSKLLWPDLTPTGPLPLNPQPYPYKMVGDSTGCAFLLKGKAGEQTVEVWNPTTQMWELKGISEVPFCHKGRFEKSDNLQLLGFEPYGLTDENAVKCVKALGGEGLIIITKRPTNASDPGCACAECNDPDRDTESVASVLPLPPTDGAEYTLSFNSGTGLYEWVLQVPNPPPPPPVVETSPFKFLAAPFLVVQEVREPGNFVPYNGTFDLTTVPGYLASYSAVLVSIDIYGYNNTRIFDLWVSINGVPRARAKMGIVSHGDSMITQVIIPIPANKSLDIAVYEFLSSVGSYEASQFKVTIDGFVR